MGNRVYVTLKDANQTVTIYQHWNGGLDTFLPISKTAFEINQKGYRSIGVPEFLAFLTKMEFRPEVQDAPEASTWLEENGHFHIDLVNSEFSYNLEAGIKQHVHNFRAEFDKHSKERMREDFQQRQLENYWFGLQIEATKYFMDLPRANLTAQEEK